MASFSGMEQVDVRRGAWTEEEDNLLRKCIEKYGEGKWRRVPMRAGLRRCRKSCRLRWLNYLKPNINRGEFEVGEIDLIIRLHKLLGNRWTLIAGRLPGRTANDIKNYWNSHLSRRLSVQTKAVQSEIKSTKTAVAAAVTTTKILRPQPRTFSPNSMWLKGAGSSMGEAQLFQISNNAIQGSPKEKSMLWWKSLFAEEEEEKEKDTWSSKIGKVGLEEELPQLGEAQLHQISSNAVPGSPQEESMLWWKSLLAEEEEKEKDTLWSEIGKVGLEEEPPQSFGAEEMERMREEGDDLMIGGALDEWDNLRLDVDLWGLLDT